MEKDFYDLLATCWRSVRAASKPRALSRGGARVAGEDHVSRGVASWVRGRRPPTTEDNEFLRLLPLTQAIAGLPDAEQGKASQTRARWSCAATTWRCVQDRAQVLLEIVK